MFIFEYKRHVESQSISRWFSLNLVLLKWVRWFHRTPQAFLAFANHLPIAHSRFTCLNVWAVFVSHNKRKWWQLFKRQFVSQHYCWPALNIVGLLGLSACRPVLLSALCCWCQRQSRSLFTPLACFNLSDMFFSYRLKTVRLIRAAGGAVWLCIHSVEVSHDIWNMLYAWNLTFGNMIPALRKRATWVDFSASYSTCRLVRLSWLTCGSVHCLPLSLQCWLGLLSFLILHWLCSRSLL